MSIFKDLEALKIRRLEQTQTAAIQTVDDRIDNLTAVDIAFTPAGGLASSNVQSALEEVAGLTGGGGGGGSGTFMIDDGTASAVGSFAFDDGGA